MSCEARPDYQSNRHGCNQLALLYDEGRGVTEDPVEAYKYCVLAELPPDDLKCMAEDLTPASLIAQRRIDEWRKRHPTDVQMWRTQSEGESFLGSYPWHRVHRPGLAVDVVGRPRRTC